MVAINPIRSSLLLALILASLAVAKPNKEVLLQLNGRHASGSVSGFDPATGAVLAGDFSPFVRPDGTEAIYAVWSACIPNAGGPPQCLASVSGEFPANSVKITGDVVNVDLDTANALTLYFSLGASRWSGQFTRYTGPLSYSVVSNGKWEQTSVLPGWPDPSETITFVERTNGNRSQTTASFTGTIAGWSLAPPAIGANATLRTSSGGQIVIQYTSH